MSKLAFTLLVTFEPNDLVVNPTQAREEMRGWIATAKKQGKLGNIFGRISVDDSDLVESESTFDKHKQES